MPSRTSLTHPIRIDALPVPGTPGVLGLTFCPGKRQPDGLTAAWERDLDTDLAAIAAWGATAVVNLIEDHEMHALRVADTAARLPPHITYYRLPMPDKGTPDAAWEHAWQTAGPQLHARLRNGERVLIHCKGGLGRTGLVAALLLVESGVTPSDAVFQVRTARADTIENNAQMRYAMSRQPGSIGSNAPPRAAGASPALPARFRGCLLGGAVGDAIGAPVEFLKRDEILAAFGPSGTTGHAHAYGGIGRITDDTQMTLFTAEGLLRGWLHGTAPGNARHVESTARAYLRLLRGWLHGDPASHARYAESTALAYLRWLHTQGEARKAALAARLDLSGWLVAQPELHHRRAPGMTCLSALRGMTRLGSPAENDSKGCGGVMRVAPVGLFAATLGDAMSMPDTFALGTQLAALTHGHPTGGLTGGVLAVLIRALVEGATLPASLDAAVALLRNMPYHAETLHALDNARMLAASDTPRTQAIRKLGEGWIAEEALAIAVYCALVAADFRDAILLAVNHDGDSDSTGAIAGNLLGARDGEAVIPPEWLEPLELREVIAQVAEALYGLTPLETATACGV